MACIELPDEEIEKRINSGETVIFLDEEYGWKWWFWFPGMSLEDVQKHWDEMTLSPGSLCTPLLPGEKVESAGGYQDKLWDAYYNKGHKAHIHNLDDSWLALQK